MNITDNIKHTFKQNLIPAIFLQITAVTLLLAYLYSSTAQSYFVHLGELKKEYGILYSAIATSLFGGVLPTLYRRFSGHINNLFVYRLFFIALLWAIIGCYVDFLYQYQVTLFGNGNDISTIFKKVAFDQFIATALVSCPFITICYLWLDHNFNWQKTRLAIGKPLLTIHLPVTLITNWAIWIPAVSIIYSFPLDMQIPLFNLVLCFFSLMVASLDRKAS
ncbi:MAG: hypothetical protein OCD00_10285 [Colwellia sp.]